MRRWPHPLALAVLLVVCPRTVSAPPSTEIRPGDRMIAAYFQQETAQVNKTCLAGIKTLDQWKARRDILRPQLFEMLGLDPLPERSDLQAVITGRVEKDGIVVEKIHFQSRPDFYVTANLYLPQKIEKPLPAILYVCGHGAVKIGGISYGNKVSYQHHGAWFARHGYACLIIDSVQLGEIEGIHHGTYREKMWWWINRGYTPAGAEAWNCIRALDYLQTRSEIDLTRIGVTGRSGGGAYSWWIAALDDRIKAAVPVAGITDLENHVVDGCVEGHCDCMYFLNTYQWDYPMVAALVAPRPLLIGNSDRDDIFPLSGVMRTYTQVRHIYELYGAGDKLGLNIVPGPHLDTQDLQVPAFRWFNKYLKNDTTTLIGEAAEKQFRPEELRVFKELPKDQRNSTIHETFVSAAVPPPVPTSPKQWQALRDGWLQALQGKSFRAWPGSAGPQKIEDVTVFPESEGLRRSLYDFTSQGPFRLRLVLLDRAEVKHPEKVVLEILDQQDWEKFEKMTPAQLRDRCKADRCTLAFAAVRGVGGTSWNQEERKQTQIRRRFMLLGQTLDGMQVWDVRRAIQVLRSVEATKDRPLVLSVRGVMAGIALYASLFEPGIAGLSLEDLPVTHRNGPIFLNVSRYLEMPQALAMAAERCPVTLQKANWADWDYALRTVKQLGWKTDRLQIVSGQ